MAKKKKPAPEKGSPFAPLAHLRDKLAQAEATKAAPPQTRPKSPPTPATSDDDALAFHRMMSGVTPLDRSRARIPKTQQAVDSSSARVLADAARRAAAAEAESVHEHLRTLVEGGSRFETSDDGRRVQGRRVELPPDVVRKLRTGARPLDARLDLHGLRADEAKGAVERFLAESRARGERCVLVVHGKGEHSIGGVGVLRGEIASWLSQGRASEHVAAFATAHETDGGEGAVYVLLR